MQRGLILKRGTIVDSTFIEVPSSTKNEKKERDPEAHLAKKGNTWHFGYNAHVGVDKESGLVHTVKVTAANEYDVIRIFRVRRFYTPITINGCTQLSPHIIQAKKKGHFCLYKYVEGDGCLYKKTHSSSQPLTPPRAMPSTNCFCRKMYSTKGNRKVSVAPAMTIP